MSLNVMYDRTHTEMEFPFLTGGQHTVKMKVFVVRNITQAKVIFF